MSKGNWAAKLAQNQRDANKAEKMPRQYRCHCCSSVEFGAPVTLCERCGNDYSRIRELADKLRAQIQRWDLEPYETIRAAWNRLVARLK